MVWSQRDAERRGLTGSLAFYVNGSDFFREPGAPSEPLVPAVPVGRPGGRCSRYRPTAPGTEMRSRPSLAVGV